MEPKAKEASVLYLRVIGRLLKDNRLLLRPSYLTADTGSANEPADSPLTAELYDASGKLLLRYGVGLAHYCAEGVTLSAWAVRGRIPFPRETRLVRFLHQGVPVHDLPVSEGQPEVVVTWKPGDVVEGKQTVTWSATHPQHLPLEYFLRYTYTGGERWLRASLRTHETSHVMDFEQFPGGTHCRVEVVATDGVNTARALSEEFAVKVKPCRAMILHPPKDSTFEKGEEVSLRGQGFYLEEEEPETERLAWTSSIDGKLGDGAVLRTRKLWPGHHQITLTAGEGERAGQTQVSILVGEGKDG
jgi:hypothetical protein